MKWLTRQWNGSWLLPVAVLTLSLIAVGCQTKAVPSTFHKLACAGIYCGAGQICDPSQGVCVPSENFCQNITCGVGQTCAYADGKCVGDPDYENPCIGLTCEGDLVCNPRTGLCVQEGTFCQGVTCHPTLQTCNGDTGVCLDANPYDPDDCPTDCAPWESCFEGVCVSNACQSHGDCPTNMECVDSECSPRSCVADYQCPFNYPGACNSVAGECAIPTCQSDGECPLEGYSCVQGNCAVATCGTTESSGCTEGYTCLLHACVYVACTSPADCENVAGCEINGCICDSNLGQCVLVADGCYSDGDCAAGDQCFHGECVGEALDSGGIGGGTGGGTGGGDPGSCDPDQYTCNDGQCIPGSWECDDYDDCAGAEDEANCPDPEPFCGDEGCGPNENCENCAVDCGPCPGEEEGGDEAGDETGGEEEGGEEGGGNPDSCVGNCGGSAPSGCYCDDGCVGFGDCCEDACEACDLCPEPPAEEEGGDEAGGTEGACNATDKAIYQAGTVDEAILICLPNCMSGGEDVGGCLTPCLSETSGLSEPCSGCFSGLYVCMLDHCLQVCMEGGNDSQPCEICLESNGCTSTFESCSGVEI